MAYQKTIQINKPINSNVAAMSFAIAENLVNKVSDAAIQKIYSKIQKNPDFLKKLAEHPMLNLLN